MAGAGSVTSSLTSTSHTLTLLPPMGPTSAASQGQGQGGGDLPERLAFLGLLEVENRHKLLRPEPAVPTASLQIVKDTLDAFAGQVSDEQQRRLQEANKKRKRDFDRADALKVRRLHVDGFETDQVWQQAKRIISSALFESTAALEALQEKGEVVDASNGAPNGAKVLEFGSDGFEEGSDDEDDSDASDGSEESEEDEEDSQAAFDSEPDFEGVDDYDEEDEEGEEVDGEEEEEEEEEDEGGEGGLNRPSSYYIEDEHGLNDGFFSIDDFNKQSQWFEDQDARADPNTDAASDDDQIDWHGDPFAQPAGSKPKEESSSGKKALKKAPKPVKNQRQEFGFDSAEEEEDDEDEEQGPTFGDMDLDAPEGASDDEFGDDQDGGAGDGLDLTANDIYYKDFFAPPAKKAKKGERMPRNNQRAMPEDYEVDAAMAGVKKDLFEDMSDESGSDEDAMSEVDAGDPKSRRSAHERRQAKIIGEIRKLESQMVKPKEWTMSGEAAAPERPLNSLLEEDLAFEHVGKAVPVVTEEVSEDIEALIKRRILAQEFDEVIRRLPGSESSSSNTRRGLVELDDSQSKQGLAELYEEDYVKENNPDTYVSQSDEKLRKEEKEVEQMWKEISGKLDALSSWHYKPKPAAAALTVVSDVATISMEDAQPTTAQGVNGGQTMLAPQEVYKAGKDTAAQGEVVTAKSGLPIARQEMSREEKLRRRRREKERIRKSGGTSSANGVSGDGKKGPSSKSRQIAKEQKETVADLKKGGVMVINRKGEITDVDGNKPKAAKVATSGSFKL